MTFQSLAFDPWRDPTFYLLLPLAFIFPFLTYKYLPFPIKLFWSYLLAQSAYIMFNPWFKSDGIEMMTDYVKLGAAQSFAITLLIPIFLLRKLTFLQ